MALDLTDKTSNGNNLTNHGATEYTADLGFATNNVRAAAVVRASSQYLSALDSTSLSITGPLTLQCWIKFDTTPSSGQSYVFLSKKDSSNQESYMFQLFNNAGTFQLLADYSTDGTHQAANRATVNWTPSISTWYHVAYVLDTTGPNVKFYVNGAQQGATQTTTGGSVFDSTSLFLIGAELPTTPQTFFDGKIDDVRVYNVARTGGQIAADYQQELHGSELNLVAYWPFEALTSLKATAGYTNPASQPITVLDVVSFN